MSLIDVHIELANQAYVSELVYELMEVINRKREILKSIETEKAEKVELKKEQKSLLDDLSKKENEILADLIRYKNWFNIPENVYKHLAKETGIDKKLNK